MSETKKRFVVELSARQTSIYRAQLVVEVPTECSMENIEELDGDMLTDIASENGIAVEWTFEEHDDDFEIQEGIDVIEATGKSPYVQLMLDEFNRLVAIQRQ